MGIFGYTMMVAFVLIWVVLLVKFLRMTSVDKKNGDEDENS